MASSIGISASAEMVESGNRVPSVKAELQAPHGVADEAETESVGVGVGGGRCGGVRNPKLEMDKDFLCPICMQMIRDAFLTACGHSFCYACIDKHLRNKSNCPCCGQFLTNSQLFPNILLSKLLKKITACQIARTVSPAENLRLSLQQGAEVSVKELDSLLTLLAEKKKKMAQEEAETNMEILLDFLQRLRQQKQDELNEVQADLQYIKEDILSVEKRRDELIKARERYFKKLHMFSDDPEEAVFGYVTAENASREGPKYFHGGFGGALPLKNFQKKGDAKVHVGNHGVPQTAKFSSSDAQVLPNLSGVTIARKRRIIAQFDDLQDCYLQKRRCWTTNAWKQCGNGLRNERDGSYTGREGYHAGLDEFQCILRTFTRYSRLRVIAELQHGDLFNSTNLVSSIEFDRDDELFATAGVSKQIKLFEFSTVVNEPADVHCPVLEMSTRSKLSCLSWNKHVKSYIASSDYEGIVTVWDVNTSQSILLYEEHEKRAWCVDFCRTDHTRLISGSDDGKVKVWCTKQENSVVNIDMKANICSVKYNPSSSHYVAIGSADHHIHYYDLRNISAPLHTFTGHRKAVSYVKFISTNELASASTDSTLRLWDVKENCLMRTFKGHTNEKNFVGLSVNAEHIACGSESNEVFVYHKAISKPSAWLKFGNSELDESDDDPSHFISAVCWKSESPTMLAANSQGTIKVLVLAP